VIQLGLDRAQTRLDIPQAFAVRELRECHAEKLIPGSRSMRGTQVAALFYTLCETAKLVGIDPHAYLLHALHAAIATPGAITYPEDLLTPQPA
jgi:hypothetical protein